jgi:hypothetical protein
LNSVPEYVEPESALFHAAALDEVDAVGGDDGDAVGVAGDSVGRRDLKDAAHVDGGLGKEEEER